MLITLGGYYIGIPLALRLKVPFVPVRKAGKLPGDVVGVSYGLEYGKAENEIQKDAVKPGAKVVIMDDLLATGGTANSACTLVRQLGVRKLTNLYLNLN